MLRYLVHHVVGIGIKILLLIAATNLSYNLLLGQPVGWDDLWVLDALATKMVKVGQTAWTFVSTFLDHFLAQIQ